jgi:integrase
MIEAVLPCVSPQVKVMIRLQMLTGMRPGEAVIMRTRDIDQTVKPWLYRPCRHKTEHLGHERVIFLGPQAQEVLRPFLKEGHSEQFLFSPVEADRDRRSKLHARRVTPLSCGNKPGTNRKRKPKRKPRDRYDVGSYARAISYGCRSAYPAPPGLNDVDLINWRQSHHWHPHQLRHNAATRLRREFGLEVAQVVLGHKTLAVTQVYAERDVESARKVMSNIG